MKLNIANIFIFSCLVFQASSLSAEQNTQQEITSGEVSVLYNDVTVLRRTVESAPIIGGGMEDYAVKIGCMGRGDCIAKIKLIYDLIALIKNTIKSCKYPVYARVIFNPDLIGYDESDKNEKEIYDIDYTGRCVTYLGKSYEINKSIFEILNTKPIILWSNGK